MQHFDYPLFLSNLEQEPLAFEILNLFEQTLSDQKNLLKVATAPTEDQLIGINTFLHQLKGILPLLSTPNLSAWLITEEKFLRQNNQLSNEYPEFVASLFEMHQEIIVFLQSRKSVC